MTMATTKFYLDRRTMRSDGTYPLKIAIIEQRKTTLYSLGIYLLEDQWDDEAGNIIAHPQKMLINGVIHKKKAEIDEFILRLALNNEILSAQEIKRRFLETIRGTPKEVKKEKISFEKQFISFIGKKSGTTKTMYEYTLTRLRRYCPELSQLDFKDINVKWLEGFDAYLAENAPSKNYRNIHLRNIRAVFNDAIDDEITTAYPFRKFKIRPVPTRKRAIPVDELRKLFDYPVEEYAVIYRDMFKLIFMLIGINAVDLFRLKGITSENRIEYSRAKTHRLYSIKVEPEAFEIIRRYQGENNLLCLADRWSDHRNFIHQCNKALQFIGVEKNKGGRLSGGAPKKTDKGKRKTGIWPGITTYWARHSWATIAASLDVPKETIAAALGHGGNSVTDIYIDFDQRKVDEANRKVLDWVLYEKI